jgi:hypothetical protein
MTGRPAQEPPEKAAGLVSKAESPRHAEQLCQSYNYELVDAGKSLKERENIWKQALDLFGVAGFDLQAPLERKQAAESAMKRLAANGRATVKLSVDIQFNDIEGTIQSALEALSQQLDEFGRSRGIGHVETCEIQGNGGILYFTAYQEKDVFDKTTLDADVPTLVKALNHDDRIASFEIRRLTDQGDKRLYYTEPDFPEDDHQEYDTHDGFSLQGLYLPRHPDSLRAEFHVFAFKETETGKTTGFTQKAVISRADVHHMPEGEIEGRLAELAHQKAVQRIQTGDFDRDEVYFQEYGDPSMKRYKIEYQPLNSTGQAGPVVAPTSVRASNKADAIVTFLDEIPDAYSEKEVVVNSRKVTLSDEEAQRVKNAGIGFVDAGGPNQAVIEGVEEVPKS